MARLEPFEDDPTRPSVPVWRGDGQPFPAGHTLSVLHGIYSDRVRAPIEEKFADVLRRSMKDGLGSAYSPELDEHAIRRAARALTTVEMVEARIEEHGYDSISDKLAEHYKTATNQVKKWLTELGLTPAARAKLGVDVAKQYDLVEALEHRRRQREVEDSPDRLCDYCQEEEAKYRVSGGRGLICASCADEGRHREDS